MHTYEVRPRKDKRGIDLISDALSLGAGRGTGEQWLTTRNVRLQSP